MLNKDEVVLSEIIKTIPHWYNGSTGLHTFSLKHNHSSISFCSHRNLTPELTELLNYVRKTIPEWSQQMPQTPTPSSIRKIREDMALFWLYRLAPFIKWDKLLAYAEWLRFRTYENQHISLNLILSDAAGGFDITTDSVQKIIDPLATSQNVYFRTNGELQFIGYEQIAWSDTKETTDYKFNPDFVQPFISILKDKDVSFHLTPRGDILILKKFGMLAAYRKGQWYIYDTNTFKNSIGEIMGSYRVGCNLFDVVFDLSYRRHGALLIYDPKHQAVEHVVNKSSILLEGKGKPDDVRTMLSSSIAGIKMGATEYEARKKKLFLEIACIDGAVLFDDNNILAFGAMIQTHTEAGGHSGARTTAAKSAYLWGGKPVKISSDGDISMLFKSRDANGKEVDSELDFM